MLTDKKISAAIPLKRPYKLADGQGMYLLVNPDGGRYWRFKYRLGGREKLLALYAQAEKDVLERIEARGK